MCKFIINKKKMFLKKSVNEKTPVSMYVKYYKTTFKNKKFSAI